MNKSTSSALGQRPEPAALFTAVYARCGKARADGLLHLAINAHLVVFPEGQRL